MSEYNFAVGDRVFVESHGFGRRKYIDVVKKVTPTGKVRVGDHLFYSTGSQSGGDTWHPYCITPVTPESEAEFKIEVRTQNLRRKLADYKWQDAPLALLESVVEVLKKGSETASGV